MSICLLFVWFVVCAAAFISFFASNALVFVSVGQRKGGRGLWRAGGVSWVRNSVLRKCACGDTQFQFMNVNIYVLISNNATSEILMKYKQNVSAPHATNTIARQDTHTHRQADTHTYRERGRARHMQANTDIVEMQIKLTERQTKKRTNKRTPAQKEAPKNQTELEVGSKQDGERKRDGGEAAKTVR